MAFVMSMSAFASDSRSAKFTLSDTAQVGSTQLAPGQYKAQWNGPDNDLKINIIQDGKTVATTQGNLKTLPSRSPYNAVVTKDTQNNTKQIDEIDFENHSQALVLTGE
jgi:hypothetical protein